MDGETSLFARVDRAVRFPGPPAKTSLLVIHHRLPYLALVIHDKGAVLSDGLLNGSALQDENFGVGVAVDEGDGDRWIDDDSGASVEGFSVHGEGISGKKIQSSYGVFGAHGQFKRGAGLQFEGPDRDVIFGVGSPGVRGGIGRDEVLSGACDDAENGGFSVGIDGGSGGDFIGPEHGEMGLHEFFCARQVEPDLKQFGGIGFVFVDERKHFGVHDPFTGGHPLDVAVPKTGGGSKGVGVIDEAVSSDGDGFEAPVRVSGESWYLFAVVHAPAVFPGKIASYLSSGQGFGGAHLGVPLWIVVKVVNAEQKRVDGGPGHAGEGEGFDDCGFHEGSPEDCG